MKVIFSRQELMFIDDSLTLIRPDEDEEFDDRPRLVFRTLAPSAGTAAPLELLNIIGAALLDAHEKELNSLEPTSTVDLSEEFLWVIREVAHSGVRYGDEPTGYNVKVKIHEALRQIRRDEVTSDMPTVPEDVTYDSTNDINTQLDAYHFLESEESPPW